MFLNMNPKRICPQIQVWLKRWNPGQLYQKLNSNSIKNFIIYIRIRFESPLSNKCDIASLSCSIGDVFLEKRSRYLRTNLLLLPTKAAGFYPSTCVYSRYSLKIQFLYCFLSSVVLWCGPIVDTERKYLKFRSADRWKMHFSWIFVGILEFYGEFWRKVDWWDTYHFLLWVRVCKYLNQRVKRIGE